MKSNRGRNQSGVALVLFALMAALIMGVLGIVLDGGRLYAERHRAQLAADAGAYGAAQELRRGNRDLTHDVRPTVVNDTSLHGFTDVNSTITVHLPPTTGSRVGNVDFVEVTIQGEVPMTFMRWFGLHNAGVAARAVAGVRRSGDACMIALDPAAGGAFQVSGNPSFHANCGIVVNSSANDAFQAAGSQECVSATYIAVTGGAAAGSCVSPIPEEGVLPMIDPLAHLTPPNPTGMPAGTATGAPSADAFSEHTAIVKNIDASDANGDGGDTTVYWPGYYNSEIEIQNGNALFMPGIYVLEAGMKVTGGTVSGDGVFFYNINSTGNDFVDVGGEAMVNLSAPTSGVFSGMLFMGPRNGNSGHPGNGNPGTGNSGNRVARGNANSSFKGTLYFPSEHLDYVGNPSPMPAWAMVIANTINISGAADASVINPPAEDEAPPSYQAILIE